jgi:hypothetical protein
MCYGPCNTDDIIDSRDVIARIEKLEAERQDLVDAVDALDEKHDECDNDTPENEAELDEVQAALLEAQDALKGWDDDYLGELTVLKDLAEQASSTPDWVYGETLVRDSYFREYTEQLVDDVYDMPKEFTSGEWPWRHMEMDWDAAAKELKSDYFDVDFEGVTYWIRG